MGGTGLGSGTFETASGHQIIPYLNTDFIYSALAQELGLIGAAGLILLYMVFVLRGFRIALFAGDGFSKLLAAGLTFGFALQTFIIVGGILRVIPLTGHHAAARLVRRLEHRRELLRPRRADARLEPRQPRAGGRAVNRQLNRLALVAIVLLVALVVATTYWQTWASAGCRTGRTTRSSASCSSPIARGLIQGADGKTVFAANRKQKLSGETLYFRRYPQHKLAAQTIGYSTQSRSQAGLERSMNDYLTGANTNLTDAFKQVLDQARQRDRARQQPRADDQAERRSGSPSSLLGDALRRRRRDEPAHRRRLRDGVDADLRPEPDRAAERLREGAEDPRRRAAARSALYNRATQGLFAPGSTFKIDHRRRRARHGHVQRRLGRSTIPATARSTASRCRTPATRTRAGREVFGHLNFVDGVPALRQLRLLQHRHQDRRGHDPRRTRRGSASTRRRRSRRPANERAPSGLYNGDAPLRPEGSAPGRSGPARLRPGADARDAAPDGDGRLDDRERRRRAEAVRRPEDRRARRLDRPQHEAGQPRPRDQARDRARR